MLEVLVDEGQEMDDMSNFKIGSTQVLDSVNYDFEHFLDDCLLSDLVMMAKNIRSSTKEVNFALLGHTLIVDEFRTEILHLYASSQVILPDFNLGN